MSALPVHRGSPVARSASVTGMEIGAVSTSAQEMTRQPGMSLASLPPSA
ncbi:MAG: hypothetical protein JWN52_1742 [Actinomycetia bacterium]|nr:hypothetical protein [Actinomycetes bacterium]